MSMAPASLQPAYSLQPSNSVTQGLLPPQGQSDTPSVPQTSQPIQQTGHPSLASSYTDYTPQIQQAQNALANYQPYSTKHPILSALTNAVGSIQPHGAIGAGISGTPGGVDAIDAGKQAALKQRVELLQGLQQQQQVDQQNAYNTAIWNKFAPQYGLPAVPDGRHIDPQVFKDAITKVGKGQAAQVWADYINKNKAHEARVGQFTRAYDAGKFPGKTYDQVMEMVGPAPQAPSIPNPFLDVNPSEFLNATNTADETGQKGVVDAYKDQTTREDNAATNKAKEEMHQQWADIAKERLNIQQLLGQGRIEEANQRNALLQDRIIELTRHDKATEGIQQQNANTRENSQSGSGIGSKAEKQAFSEMNKWDKEVGDTEAALEKLSKEYGKVPHGFQNDPRYAALNQRWKYAVANRNRALQAYRQLGGGGGGPQQVTATPHSSGKAIAPPKIQGFVFH